MTAPGRASVAFWAALARLSSAGGPRVTAISLGVVSAGVGILCVGLRERVEASPPFAYMAAVLPIHIWGLIFYGVGIALASTAAVAYRRAHVLCWIAGLLLFLFAGLTALPAVLTPGGTGITSWLAVALGWICVLNALSASASDIERQGDGRRATEAARSHEH